MWRTAIGAYPRGHRMLTPPSILTLRVGSSTRPSRDPCGRTDGARLGPSHLALTFGFVITSLSAALKGIAVAPTVRYGICPGTHLVADAGAIDLPPMPRHYVRHG